MKEQNYTFRGISMLLTLLCFVVNLQAQRISGKIKDAETGEGLIGATIAVKNTSRGATTDANGQFVLEARNGEALVVSYVGYNTLEINATEGSPMEIGLSQGSVLKEVTVTALGISREKKSLGYAVQEVSGASLDKARETNVINALSGKVAGLTIVGNPSGIGASARVTIRGERSLNINRNQPLFVVDGVPISNEFRGSSGSSFQEADYGNGAGFVNPDDIETITVLKGASSTALYGSRANNGVILITTKSGKSTKASVWRSIQL